jgi:hypothetical protein
LTTNAGGPPTGTFVADDNNDADHHDYITMDDLFRDDPGDKGDNEDVGATLLELEDVELFKNITNYLDEDDVLFGNPRWLKNFREMKQTAINALYKKDDCPKHMVALRFNIKMLIVKACHGFSDAGFNELLDVLAEPFPEGNKLPMNTYQEKKIIHIVAMKLKKFDAYPNHCTLFRGEYEELESCPHCRASRWKKNASFRVDDDPFRASLVDREMEGIHGGWIPLLFKIE